MLVVADRGVSEELAQEAFSRALARWDRLASDEHRLRFTMMVALNLGRTHLRRERVASAWLLRRSTRPYSAASGDEADDRLTLRTTLAGLSARQRSCVALVDYLGLEPSAAARLLGMRHSTLRVHLTRARRTLAARLRSTYLEEADD
jgi:RNA polymerase sigma factor (sigma-70 family)